MSGCGDARNWGIGDIRRVTGRDNLHPGTLNVRLDVPHGLRVDHTLRKEERTDRRPEDLYFECCSILWRGRIVPALIARTSVNFHGDYVLEIMAEWVDDIQTGDSIEVEVKIE